MRNIIMHVDVNSAFLSWTAAYRCLHQGATVDLREISAVIGGDADTRHGIVLAKSIEAKKYKIETGEPLGTARTKCPGLVIVPPDYALYVACSKEFITLLRRFAPVVEQYSIDEAWIDLTGTESIYGDPLVFAEFLRETIYNELGFTVNIGVSCNRLLAKMASEMRKPNLVHSLFPEQIENKMWPLPVRELFYVGHATEKKLHAMGIHTIGELAKTDPKYLKLVLKKHGEMIHNFAHGKSETLDALIKSQQSENQGYGNSLTLPIDFSSLDDIKQAILSLVETIGARLRADEVRIKTLAVSIGYYDFTHTGHQCQLFSASNVTEEIYDAAVRLFMEVWDKRPIRQVGIHTSKATKEKNRQYNLFDLDRFDRQEAMDAAVDKIRMRYGKDSVMRACFLQHQHLSHMSGGISSEKIGGMTKPMR